MFISRGNSTEIVEIIHYLLLGRKAGKGMFLYENGKRVGSNPRAKEIIEKYGFTSKMK